MIIFCFFAFISSKLQSLSFGQRIDHFNYSSNSTFEQFYLIDDSYYNPNNSLSFIVEISDTWSLCKRFCSTAEKIAQQTQSKLLGIEHRYFGKSNPIMQNITQDIKYLQISQVLADMISILNLLYNDTSTQAKSIAIGKGYAGSLASWSRMKYPQFVVGAWSSYAPLLANENNTHYFSNLLKKIDGICDSHSSENISFIFGNISQKLIKGEEIDDITSNFTLGNITDLEEAFFAITESLGFLYSDGYLSESICKVSSYAEYASILNGYLSALPKSKKFTLADMLPQNLKNSDNMTETRSNFRSKWFLKCAELGQFHFPLKYSFPNISINLDRNFYLSKCNELFGFPNVFGNYEMTNIEYGNQDPKTSTVIYTIDNDDVDNKLMILEGTINDEIYIKKLHNVKSPSQDMTADDVNESVEVAIIREENINLLERWIHSQCANSCIHGKCIGNTCICIEEWNGENCTDQYLSPKKFKLITGMSTTVPTFVLLVSALIAWCTIIKEPGVYSSQNYNYH